MKLGYLTAVATFVLVAATGMASATGNHAVETRALRRAAAGVASPDAQRRAAIAATLEHPQVRAVAEAAGLDIVEARDAVSTLSGAELETISQQAAQVDDALAGGDTIVISASAVIIILLILILIAVS